MLGRGGLEQGRACRREQPYAMPVLGQASQQVQRLPLAAAHLHAGVDVQSVQNYLRGLMFLALAYFKKL